LSQPISHIIEHRSKLAQFIAVGFEQRFPEIGVA
jgi:hypothetical protein